MIEAINVTRQLWFKIMQKPDTSSTLMTLLLEDHLSIFGMTPFDQMTKDVKSTFIFAN